MTPDSFKLYTDRLNSIREGLTEPNRIKFIDDIFEALKYKDAVIDNLHVERSKLMETNMKLRTERDRFKSQRDFLNRILDKVQLGLTKD